MKLRLLLVVAFIVGAFGEAQAQGPGLQPIVGSTQLNLARRAHTATLLDDGTVLIVGGDNQAGMVAQAEVFDPMAQSSVLGALLATARTDHTATKLANGQVLVIGGRDTSGVLTSTEIYDPLTAAFTPGPFMTTPRSGHTATVLSDGRILIAGGDATGSAELYDPSTQGFSTVAGHLNTARRLHSALLTQSGQVLIVGGVSSQSTLLNTAEIYDPSSQYFYLPPTDLETPRALATLKLLPDGKVQVIGGDAGHSMEVFDTSLGWFNAQAVLPPTVESLAATLSTQSRAALISPGISQDQFLQGALTPDHLALLNRADHSITEIPSQNRALVAGGIDGSGQILNTATLVSSSSASITTDKTDYVPGHIVSITGVGFQPNEPVTINLHETPDAYPDPTLVATADGHGAFVSTEFSPRIIDIGRTFTLTAIGQSSGFTAQTTFTDDLRIRVLRDGPPDIAVASGETFTVQFTIESDSEFLGAPVPVSGNYALTFASTLTLVAGPATSDNFADLVPSVPFTLAWTFQAPVGFAQEDLTIVFSASITSPSCSGSLCSDTIGYFVDVAAAPGTIRIVKNTVGGDGIFGFEISGEESFALRHITTAGATGTAPDYTAHTGFYTVSEVMLPGWDLTSSLSHGCSNGVVTFSNSFLLTPGQTVTCTFTNTRRGRIITEEGTEQGASFNFTLTGGPDSINQSFSLISGVTNDSGLIKPGSYSLTQTVPSGWDLTTTCFTLSAGSSSSNTNSPPTAFITLAAGELVRCVFTNRRQLIDVTLTLGNLTHVYDGTPKQATVSTNPAGVAVALEYSQGGQVVANPIAAGSYDVVATVTQAGHVGSAAGVLTIARAALTITADNQTMVLNGVLPSLTISYSGFAPGESPANLDTAVSVSTAATGNTIGSFPIVPSGASDTNYLITFINGTLSVTFAPLGACLDGPGHQILQPINVDGTSVVKKGSTAPARFRVCDAAGHSFGTPGVVQSFALVQILSGTTSTEINEPVDSTTPDTAFRWSGDHWIFNISTKNLTANKTYVYRITLADASVITFQFGLK